MQANKFLQAYSRCVSYCTAASYDLLGLASFFKKRGFTTRISRDALHIVNSKKSVDVYFFNFGSFVCWGLKKPAEDKLLEQVAQFAIRPLHPIETDYFYYNYSNITRLETHEHLRLDIINLESDDPQIKLAISYALAQSVKLESYEESIKEVIKKNDNLPEEIATRGTISLSRRAIFKRMGEIFLARSSINVNAEYLEVPEFFWRHPNLETYYISTKKFLDIPSRVMALNQKLDVLQELLYILNSQVQHHYSSLLESIIILLIAVEIIISLFQFHLV